MTENQTAGGAGGVDPVTAEIIRVGLVAITQEMKSNLMRTAVIDCVFRALAAVTPTAAIAGHHADLALVNYYGMDKRTGRFFMVSGGLGGRGWGATDGADGVRPTVCITTATPQPAGRGPGGEAPSRRRPVQPAPRLRRPRPVPRQPRHGPLPAAAHRGEGGLLRRAHQARPWGVAAGGDAQPNRIRVRRADGTELIFPNGKSTTSPFPRTTPTSWRRAAAASATREPAQPLMS